MISNLEQLRHTQEALSNVENSLYALKKKIYEQNPELFFSFAQDYVSLIEDMRNEINEFLGLSLINEGKAPLWITIFGREIELWSTPTSVWIDILAKMKSNVFSIAKMLGGKIENQSSMFENKIKNLSDFEVSALEKGSLKLGLSFHETDQSQLFPSAVDVKATELVEQALEKLLETSNWLSGGKSIEELNSLFESESQRNYVVSKVLNLLPSTRTKFSFIEFSGSILPVDKPIKLTIQSRNRISEIVKKSVDEIEKITIGVIREVDLDKKHFILRQREDNQPDLHCKFDETSFEQVKDSLDHKVRITGLIKKNKPQILYLKFVEQIES